MPFINIHHNTKGVLILNMDAKSNQKKKHIKLIVTIITVIVLFALGYYGIGYLFDTSETSQSIDDEEILTENSSSIKQAPNMWVHWQDYSDEYHIYDAITTDWRCIDSADETYWAVHCWDFGYAGFQNDIYGNKVILLSLWDLEDGTKPMVEYYYSDYNYGTFDNEGCGSYIFTPYEWEVGVWYSMKVEITYDSDYTYFTQYVKQSESDEPWKKTACLKYPAYYELNSTPSSFQEDYWPNNLKRSCEIKNAGGRIMSTSEWKKWDACEIVTSFYPDFPDPDNWLDNVSFDCDYEVNDSTIKLITGGAEYEPNDKTYPVVIPLS